jgi:hypothetical protein
LVATCCFRKASIGDGDNEAVLLPPGSPDDGNGEAGGDSARNGREVEQRGDLGGEARDAIGC